MGRNATIGIVTLAVIISAAFTFTSALDCSNVVVKEQEGLLNWLGNVTFTVPVSTTQPAGWYMDIYFDQPFTGVGGWVIWIQSHGQEKWAHFTNREENAVLTQGQEFTFRFRVNWFTDVTDIPKVVSLKFFDIELCR